MLRFENKKGVDNCLALSQLLPNESYLNTRTTEANAHMYFRTKSSSYMGVYTNAWIQLY